MEITYQEDEFDCHLTDRDYNSFARAVSQHARVWMSSLLILSDAVSLILAGLTAVVLRGWWGYNFNAEPYIKLIPLVLVFVGVFYWRRLYPAIGLGAVEELRRLVVNTTLVFLTMAAFAFMSQVEYLYSRAVFIMIWLFALVLVALGRTLLRAVLARLNLWGEPVAVTGPRDRTAEISAMLKHHPKIGLRPTQVCTNSTCVAGLGRQALSLPNQGMSSEACRRCPVRLARVALVVYTDLSELESAREKYRDTFQRVILVNARDHGLSLSSTSVREFGGLTGLEIHQNLLDIWAQMEKRVIDLIGSALGILVLSPFLALFAALIYLDSPGRIFYHQKRVGKNGKLFQMLKFRTMRLNADQVLKNYLENDPALKQEWDLYQKLHKDFRITRFGHFLRRFSIDELPQLWNVFLGEMSLVGPRPIMVDQQELYGTSLDHYGRVTPGITGLWQISGRNKTTFARRAELDVHYVMNWSVWLDIYILVRTVWVVLKREGAS